MTAQIGADGLDLFGDPLLELLTDVARVQPQPGRECVNLEKHPGFHSTQRLRIDDHSPGFWVRRVSRCWRQSTRAHSGACRLPEHCTVAWR